MGFAQIKVWTITCDECGKRFALDSEFQFSVYETRQKARQAVWDHEAQEFVKGRKKVLCSIACRKKLTGSAEIGGSSPGKAKVPHEAH